MKVQFSIATLLNLTVLVAFLAWVCTLDGGGALLLGLGFWCAGALVIYGMVRVFAFIFGTPGQRQRQRLNDLDREPDGSDVTPQ
jgi:hypothetical protein